MPCCFFRTFYDTSWSVDVWFPIHQATLSWVLPKPFRPEINLPLYLMSSLLCHSVTSSSPPISQAAACPPLYLLSPYIFFWFQENFGGTVNHQKIFEGWSDVLNVLDLKCTLCCWAYVELVVFKPVRYCKQWQTTIVFYSKCCHIEIVIMLIWMRTL